MTNSVWTNLITAMHGNEHQAVLAITGGGSAAIGQLLEVPGGSKTVLEAVVPYAPTALTAWLGSVAEQSCSQHTARSMAMAAWIHARALAPDADPSQLIGVGATASLVSAQPKRGEHRVHVATQTATATAVYSLVLNKGPRDRKAEEALAAQLVLLAMAETCRLEVAEAVTAMNGKLLSEEQVICSEQDAASRWTNLLLGDRSHIGYPSSLNPQAVFPGAFNPPHAGHQRMVRLAAAKLGCPVAYELSLTNVDKPPLDFMELKTRLKALQDFDSQTPILLTDAPTFRAKATLFPGCTFVVGADTMARIADPLYYSGEPAGFPGAIRQIADQGCRFLVFGREIDGQFRTLSQLTLPESLRQLCNEVSAEEFREDVSSTALRAGVQS